MLKWHSVENVNHGVIKQELILSVRICSVLLTFFHTPDRDVVAKDQIRTIIYQVLEFSVISFSNSNAS
jgi:hypothetical protein